jgi:hypothetical protein
VLLNEESMRRWIGVLGTTMLCAACENSAEDCMNTLSCDPAPTPDAGATVIYVGSDAGDPACEGTCVRGKVNDWQEPYLMYLGADETLAPSCPDGASGQRDFRAPPPAQACGVCECNPPTGSCMLPGTASANNAACPATDPGTVQTPFDPPGGWEGTCTAQDAIPLGSMCGTGPCVQSLTIPPLTLKEDPCVPKPPVVPLDDKTGRTLARACGGNAYGKCQNTTNDCLPPQPVKTPQDPLGFWTYCIQHDGADDDYTSVCPPNSPYQNKYVFMIDYEDMRTCTPCACDPPQGSTCSSLITVYTDNVCSAQLASDTVMADAAMCVNLPSGAPSLGSKTATPPLYKPGICAAHGGEPTGDVHKIAPITFCCVN